MEPRLKDIAAIANVSIGTVSRVVNGLDRVKPETRHRVQQVIEEVGYTRNSAAVTLARQGVKRKRRPRTELKGRRIGLVYWEEHLGAISAEPVYSSVMEGIQRFCQEHNRHFQARVVREEPNHPSELFKGLLQDLDGVVLIGEVPSTMVEYIETHRIPSVHFGSSRRYAKSSTFVTPDNFDGAYQAVKHLVALGHRWIGFINSNQEKNSFTERMRGYVAALIESGIEPRREYYCYKGQGQLSGYQAMPRFLRLREPPTALFCANDATAFGVLKFCTENGVNVPRDLSVVGFDDTVYAEYSVPALTTVRQMMLLSGRVAAAELFEAIARKDYIPRRVILRTELVVRSSTGPPRGA